MDIQKLTIGQMAEMNNISTQALRHYDKVGLLAPYFTDNETGYRYYHINQSSRLDMIQYLQSNGASLKEIKELLDLSNNNHESFVDLLQVRLDSINKDLKEIYHKKASLSRMIENHKKYKNIPFDETVFFEYIPERKIYVYETETNFFEKATTGYEIMLRELKTELASSEYLSKYFCNVGTMVRTKHLSRDKLFSNEVFFFIEDEFEESQNIEVLPSNMYICLCSQDYTSEERLAKKLLKAVEDNDCQIIGDYICEVVVDFPGFENNPRTTFFKMQIPVKTKL